MVSADNGIATDKTRQHCI